MHASIISKREEEVHDCGGNISVETIHTSIHMYKSAAVFDPTECVCYKLIYKMQN